MIPAIFIALGLAGVVTSVSAINRKTGPVSGGGFILVVVLAASTGLLITGLLSI